MTKVAWDYSDLADAYVHRPDYAPDAIRALIETAGISPAGRACDIGAGVGHLTLHLLARGMTVTAVEPNDNMRALGIRRTEGKGAVQWFDGTGENTGQSDDTFDLATFGSSFNVTDRPAALRETARILKPGGWFACLWNHRDLNDPLQAEVEAIIHRAVPDYGYGNRREDQSDVITASGLFTLVQTFEGSVVHAVPVEQYVNAWRSHATLARQAGDAFPVIVNDIEALVTATADRSLSIPYTTRGWMARKASA